MSLMDNNKKNLKKETKFTSSVYTNLTSSTRHRRFHSSQSFVHDSYTSSLDFPAYIPWQTLSTDVSDKLRNGSIKINRSNCIEWTTIKEENEKLPLLDRSSAEGSNKGVSSAISQGISWPVAAFLLVNCALGAGILNYPAAYDRLGGVFIATILQIIMMIILGSTLIIIAYSSDINKDCTYHDVLFSICGKRAQQVAALSILLTCYGICITYLIIIGDQYERIFESHLPGCYWFTDRRFTIIMTSVVFILPICFSKRLDFLRYAGTLGVFSMFYVVFINIYQYFALERTNVEYRTRPESTVSMLAVLPVITFAFQSHEIAVPVYASMKHRKLANFSKAAIFSLLILFLIYVTAGTCGYLTFGTKALPDIMQSYDARDPIVMVGIMALAVKMITTYPPMLFCGRGALDGLYAEFTKISAADFIEGEKTRRIIITTFWFISSLILAIFTPNIGIVIELLGSLASINVFIFPSLCLLHIIRNRKMRYFSKAAGIIFVAFLIILGIFMFIIVLFQVYQDLAIGESFVRHHRCSNATF